MESLGRSSTLESGLSFHDANIALVARDSHFFVHQGVLMRHSKVFAKAIHDLRPDTPTSEGKVILKLDDEPLELYSFLLALYDGM